MNTGASHQLDETPVISVVIPTRQGGKHLARAIASVLTQTEQRFELIVVTDCGAVAAEPAEQATQTDSRVRYVDLLNKTGANAARNLGSTLCHSEIVTYLDADDEYLPDALSNRYALLTENEDAGFAVSSHFSVSSNRTIRKINHQSVLPKRGLEIPVLASTLHISASTLVVRRSLLDQIGGWNEKLARLQDRDLLLRLTQVAPCAVSAKADLRKFETAGSITSSHKNYMQAYSHFLEENSEIVKSYRKLIGFRVANRLIVLISRGQIRQTYNTYRQNLSHSNLKFGIFELVYIFLLRILSGPHSSRARGQMFQNERKPF